MRAHVSTQITLSLAMVLAGPLLSVMSQQTQPKGGRPAAPGGQPNVTRPLPSPQPADKGIPVDYQGLSEYFHGSKATVGKQLGEPAMRFDLVAKHDFPEPELIAWIYLRGPRGQVRIVNELLMLDRERWRRGDRGQAMILLPKTNFGSEFYGWTITGVRFSSELAIEGDTVPRRFDFDR